MSQPHVLFSEAILLLGGAVVSAPLFKRLGLGTVLGYLAAGVVIGPVAQLITGGGEILSVAELGVVFLLFIIGLELRATNEAAFAFYSALGYRELGRVPGYYQGVEPAIRMARDVRTGTTLNPNLKQPAP